ncbi:hypothetical protein PHLCEN_2v7234 [Hermanssonia centrifuga]|uniref:Metallo-beta-lactamase domain-containing protein n=1 Tax=Hermanssonia centrifuga TaxID=98765 RepID=A0A2R6NX89_9APHY|nr:hypothetical protein PHLCEN_2v7234 [Hermanssonia centrifuga]
MEDDSVEKASTHRQPGPCTKKAAFKATRLTPTVFLVNEHSDIYDERPFIYVKTISSANTLLILDTGCGGATDKPDIKITSLREFLETCDVEDNEGKPLNVGGKMQYVIVLTDYSTPTPNYSTSLGVVVHHTPGHTPDELALWDESERMLYVGDTVYEWEHIIFPKEGSIVQWLQSMDALIELVGTSEANICCGHVTAGRPAKDVLTAAKAFVMDVLSEKESVRSRFEKRGEVSVEYVQAGSRFSLICPERLVVVARQKVLAA